MNDAGVPVVSPREEGNEQNNEISKEWDLKARDSSEEVLIELLLDLDNLTPNLLLSKTELDRCSELLVQVWEKNLLHGRKREHVIGAVLVIALRDLGKPRPLGVVANELDVERVSIQRVIKKILRELPLSLSPPQAVDYLPFVGALLTLDKEVQSAAAAVLDQCETGLGDPAVTAVAALYLVAKPRGIAITYSSAGAAAGSAKETVWKRAKLLRDR
ncbi:hypothetical protein [Halorubrum gandharaense]